MRLRTLVPLAPLTTFRVGGPARYFGVVKTLADLREGALFARREHLPVFILGGGSNVVVADEGFPGVVLKIGIKGLVRSPVSENIVEMVAGAGETWDVFVKETTRSGLWGVENLAGIPGTVGASPIQNIGAYGAEIKDVVAWVEVCDMNTGNVRVVSSAECGFGYRTSVFKNEAGRHLVVTRVAFHLSFLPCPNLLYKDLAEHLAHFDISVLTPEDVRAAVLSIRQEKFPPLCSAGTAGSFFKNPVVGASVLKTLRVLYPDIPAFPAETGEFKVPLAWILDHILHLKGYRRGNVELFPRQPLVVSAFRGATAHDINAFADDIAARVHTVSGIIIEREVVSVK